MNLKFKKHFRLSFNSNNDLSLINVNNLKYGTYGIQALSFSIVTYKQINSFRIKLSRSLKKTESLKFKIYIRIFFICPITQKPKLTRMGKGSGAIRKWVGLLKPGLIFIELNSEIPKSLIKKAFYLSSYLISINLLFVEKK